MPSRMKTKRLPRYHQQFLIIAI
jgi:curved DNA-binding protein CbpA